MDRIAAEAGVNKAALYYHVGNKQALYTAVLHSVFVTTTDKLRESISSERLPEAKLTAYVRNFIQTVEENPAIPPIMLRELAAGGRSFPPIIVEDFLQIISLLDSILVEGVEQGDFIPMNPLLLHLMIIGPVALYSRIRNMATHTTDIPLHMLEKGPFQGLLENELLPGILGAVRAPALPVPERGTP
jgi:TetR/AcrR family transcriptional regulator